MRIPRSLVRCRPVALLGVAIGLFAACGSGPPVLHGVPTDPPPAPALPTPPGPETLGWVRARQVLRTIDRLGVGSTATAVAAMGVEASLPDPDRPFIVALSAPPAPDVGQVPGLVFAPAAPDSTLATLLAGFSPGGATPLAGGVAFPLIGATSVEGPNRAIVETLAAVPATADAEVVVHAPTVLRAFGESVTAALRGLPAALASAAGQPVAFQPAALQAAGEALGRWFGDVATVLLLAEVGETALSATLVARGPAASANTAPEATTTLPPYARFVPPGAVRAAFRWTRADGPGVAEALADAVLAGLPEAQAAVRTDLRAFTGALCGGALSVGPGGPGVMRGLVLLQSDAAPAMRAALLDIAARLAEPAVTEAFWRRTITLKAEITPHARESRGVPVARIRVTVAPGPGLGAAAKSPLFVRLFARPIEIELVQVDETLIVTFDEAPAVLDGTLAALHDGRGVHPELSARSTTPDGGDLYVDVDAAGGLAEWASVLGPAAARRLPRVPADAGVVTVFGASSSSLRQHRLTMPRAVFDALRNAGR
jgi:hypothetical protein